MTKLWFRRSALFVAFALLFAAAPRLWAQEDTSVADARCDSVLRAAQVDTVGVTARAYLVRRDGATMPPRARMFLLESILSHFLPPKPLRLPVFAPGPSPMRMLHAEHLGADSAASREPVLYGVYDFSILRSGGITKVTTGVPSMTPAFDARIIAAIEGTVADSAPAIVARALGGDVIALELRISTGPEDTRFRVPTARLFAATFPRLRLNDARTTGVLPLAEYPEDERDDGRDGEVMLRVVVDGSGAAIIPTLEVLHATSPAFALAAARTLARYHFMPARVGSCTVPQVVEIPFWFSLRP
ncbi:MAG TPA: energy transducer TonB [Gemmatimonadaceae bacterium]|nr:energy transducer TonB [Gemmatimonadaceae bacterium]